MAFDGEERAQVHEHVHREIDQEPRQGELIAADGCDADEQVSGLGDRGIREQALGTLLSQREQVAHAHRHGRKQHQQCGSSSHRASVVSSHTTVARFSGSE